MLQTPVYLTRRNFDDTLNLIESLESRGLLDLLFVQDVGLLSELEASNFEVPICWSVWGKGRGEALTRDLLDFLMQLNVQYIELYKPSRVGPVQAYGLKVVFRLYAPQVATYGRICYTRYVTGLPCNGRLCTHEQANIASMDGKLNLRVNGYTLEYAGPFLRPSPKASPDCVTVYVEDLARLPEVLENVPGYGR